ncbi:MAG: hypothetical protein WBI07_13045 [Mobilitalea sp.]
MKTRSWISNLINLILLLFLIVMKENVDKLALDSYYKFNSSSLICYTVISILLGLCIGLFLGLEHFTNEIGKGGIWKINLPKLILIGIPSFYFSLANVWIFSGSKFLLNIIAFPLIHFLGFGSSYISLFQIVLGFTVITSFYMVKNN